MFQEQVFLYQITVDIDKINFRLKFNEIWWILTLGKLVQIK